MTKETAIRIVKDIIEQNRENGELEGVLDRSRVAALNRLLALAEPDYHVKRVGRRLVIYRRIASLRSTSPRYKRIDSIAPSNL